MWLDNTAAIKWTNSLNSPNKLGQQLCRTLAVLLAQYGLHVTAQHLPGIRNTIADAGSRSWGSTEHASTWQSFTKSWSACQVPAELRKAYDTSDDVATLWRQLPVVSTAPTGTSGPTGATERAPHIAS